MANYREYSKTAANNTARFPEGMQRQNLNDQLRDMESRHRTFAEELPWFEFSDSSAYLNATQFTVPGDLTSFLTVGSKVRAVGSTTGDIQGEITESAYTSLTTVTVVWDSGQLENESLTIYRDVGGGFAADTIVGQTVVNTNAPSTTVHQITAQNSGRLFLLDDTAGNIDLETPASGAISNGFFFRFKLVGAGGNTVRVTTPGAETIDDGTTWTIPQQYASGTIAWDGNEWWIVTLGRNGLATGEVVTSKLGDGSVTQSKLADDAVALANMEHGTGGKILGYNEDGVPAEVDAATGNSVARVKCIMGKRAAGGETQSFATYADEIYAMGIGANNANGSHQGGTYSLPRKCSGFPSDKSVAKIVSGYRCHYVLTTDGKVYAWGRNSNGELGLGDTASRDLMQQITAIDADTITDVVVTYGESAFGNSAFFLTDGGEVWSVGDNSNGRLGLGDTTQRTTPVKIGSLTNVSSIATGGEREAHTIAVLTDGTIRVWGNNDSGQLGMGDTTDRTSPAQPGGVTDVAEAHVGSGSDGGTISGFSILRKTDGSLLAAGDNKSGCLGQGNTTDLNSFTAITFSPAATITAVSVIGGASGHVIALDDTGEVWVWGDNAQGQCGTGNTTDQTSPQKPTGGWQGSIVGILALGSERYGGSAVWSPNALYSSGYGGNYNVVRGDVGNQTSFGEVLGLDGAGIQDVSCHGDASGWGITVLTTDGRILTGGIGTSGQLGNGHTLSSGDLQPVKGFSEKANNPLPNDRGAWALSTRYELGDLTNKAGPPVTNYICKAVHVSSSGTEPGVGASWASYWTFVGAQTRDIGNVTVAGLAGFAAASYTGWQGFITDETGGAVPAFSDGTDWRRVTDRAVVS